MTFSSHRKRQTTARPSRGRWTSRGLLAASLVGGCLAAAASFAKPADAPAQEPVTVYYERLPDGTIRQVSSAPLQPVQKKPEPTVKPAALPSNVQQSALLPTRPVAPPAITQVNNQDGFVPARAVVQAATTNSRPQTLMQIPATIPAAPAFRQVAMQQPGVLPALDETPVAPKAPPSALIMPTQAETPSIPRALESVSPQTPPALQPSQIPTSDQERTETLKDYNIETEPPSLDRLYRLDSETVLKKRMEEEIRKRPVQPGSAQEILIKFPMYKPLTDEKYEPRQLGGLVKQIEPNYVVHGRLYTEELNSERYGWDLGFIQPAVSSTIALKDFLLVPYNFATRPCQRFEASAGKCYPGDPVPYLWYPPELSLTGAALETGMFLAVFALVP